jgi:hypothetical protein
MSEITHYPEDDELNAEQFQVAYEALVRADPATYLDGVVGLFGERLPHGAIRVLEIAAAALRAAAPLEQEVERLRKLATYIEARLASVPVPSGQPEVSRAFTDIRQSIVHVAATGGRP